MSGLHTLNLSNAISFFGCLQKCIYLWKSFKKMDLYIFIFMYLVLSSYLCVIVHFFDWLKQQKVKMNIIKFGCHCALIKQVIFVF